MNLSSVLKYSLMITCGLSLMSCEKDVEFNLPTSIAEKVVVEGKIESGEYPMVLLSNSFGFFSKLDFNNLQNNFLHNATIKVDDGINSVILKEYNQQVGTFTFSYYTIDSSDAVAANFKGVVGRTYDLSIDYDGKNYTASSMIHPPIRIDSFWSEPLLSPIDDKEDLRELHIKYTDPSTGGNAYRIFTDVNNSGFMTSKFSVSDDALDNGTTVKTTINAGYDKMDTTNSEYRGYVYVDDSVILNFSSIDNGVYTFWKTFEFSVGTVGNPFSSPVEITSNIKNGALGVWAGYCKNYYYLKVK